MEGALDVAVDEGRALVVEVGGPPAPQGDLRDLLRGNAERLPGRLLEEGARPRAAGFVHGVVRGHASRQEGVLGVLAADFEDRVDARVEPDGGGGVGGDLVDDALRHRVQARDLAARARHAEALDADPCGKRAQLLAERAIAGARGAHGVAVGAQVHGGHNGVVPAAQQDGLRGRRAHVEPQDQHVPRPCLRPARGPEFDEIAEVAEGTKDGKRALRASEKAAGARIRERLVLEGPEGRAERLEVRGLVGDLEIRDLLAQPVHHDAVAGRAPDDHDVPPGDPPEDLEDLPRHHLAQARRDAPLRHALVGGVGAVALAEDAAASRDPVGALRAGKPRGLLHAHAEALDLLEEELARARGALVARLDRRDAAVLPEGVDEKGLAAGADDGLEIPAPPVEMAEGMLHGLGLGNGGEVEELAEPPARDAHAVVAGRVDAAEQLQEGAAGISVMGLDARVNQRNRAAFVPFEACRTDRGRPDADPERLHRVPHESQKAGILPAANPGVNAGRRTPTTSSDETSPLWTKRRVSARGKTKSGFRAERGPGCPVRAVRRPGRMDETDMMDRADENPLPPYIRRVYQSAGRALPWAHRPEKIKWTSGPGSCGRFSTGWRRATTGATAPCRS